MITVPKWRNVPAADREALFARGHVNGCGPKTKGLHRIIPDRLLGLHLEEDCFHHDWNYLLGGTEADRLKADWQFYERMRERARAATSRWWNVWLRPLYVSTAWTYYQAVRHLGRGSFSYTPMTPDDYAALVA